MNKEVKHIYISKTCLFINGQLVLKGENAIFVKFLKEVYKFIDIKYPKYFKMDPLSKLGFLASEVLLKEEELSEQVERIGIVLENRVSTYLVDSKHQLTLNDKENYFPSPANFVYTLPNVMTGEICIRNGFKGENAVFINDRFDADFVVKYMKSMYRSEKTDVILGGYVDADEDTYEAFMFLSKKEDFDSLLAADIDRFYTESKGLIENMK